MSRRNVFNFDKPTNKYTYNSKLSHVLDSMTEDAVFNAKIKKYEAKYLHTKFVLTSNIICVQHISLEYLCMRAVFWTLFKWSK